MKTTTLPVIYLALIIALFAYGCREREQIARTTSQQTQESTHANEISSVEPSSNDASFLSYPTLRLDPTERRILTRMVQLRRFAGQEVTIFGGNTTIVVRVWLYDITVTILQDDEASGLILSPRECEIRFPHLVPEINHALRSMIDMEERLSGRTSESIEGYRGQSWVHRVQGEVLGSGGTGSSPENNK